jgi:DNA-binding PadR family transcriptional regulator
LGTNFFPIADLASLLARTFASRAYDFRCAATDLTGSDIHRLAILHHDDLADVIIVHLGQGGAPDLPHPASRLKLSKPANRRSQLGGSKNEMDIHSITMYSGVMVDKELIAASTEPLILSLLARQENYGYELIQQVRRLSEGEIEWTDGMLYPVLHRMERKGLIKARWVVVENGRKRKYYSIKPHGQDALKKRREQWNAVHSVFRGLWRAQHV